MLSIFSKIYPPHTHNYRPNDRNAPQKNKNELKINQIENTHIQSTCTQTKIITVGIVILKILIVQLPPLCITPHKFAFTLSRRIEKAFCFSASNNSFCSNKNIYTGTSLKKKSTS